MTADQATQNATHGCPVCGDNGHLKFLCQTDGKDIYACATCGADHVFPMPDERALKAYYDRREWFEGGEKGGYENYDAQTAEAAHAVTALLKPFAGREGLSILDVGCGYGNHLKAAVDMGWKAFGVEPSAHARGVAQERLDGKAFIVENIADLIPHEFDVVLLMDVVEHLPSPYPTFYQLFSIGAITAKTVVVVTTPNAGSDDAKQNPATWPYRHPASHLVHYAPSALTYVLQRLHFKNIVIEGTSPQGGAAKTDIPRCAGLLATAQGSDFAEFMRERYVPGTWSKIAEYEHLPRYALAKTLVAGKAVLDFGCGTGYGAAMMAESAASVTGLDIDAQALAWAQNSHRAKCLSFRRHDDLGASLPDASFDLVTCFEMIEHVDHQTQKATVANIARLLRNDGLLLISTPNPDVTALYGANPYHIREMSEAEFRELLSPHFPHIRILRQYVRVGIAVDQENTDARLTPGAVTSNASASETKPLAFIALCSRAPIPEVPNRVLFDREVDYIEQYMAKENALNKIRMESYLKGELSQSLKGQLTRVIGERNVVQDELRTTISTLDTRNHELEARDRQLNALEDRRRHEEAVAAAALNAKAEKLHVLQRIREAEHASPRFLARQLILATRARMKAILRSRFSRE